MKNTPIKRWLAVLLSLIMAITILPSSGFAATTKITSSTKTNVDKVISYAKQLDSTNASNYSTARFSWDTEQKYNGWAYFNGLMMDAFLDVDASTYANHVDTFYSTFINSDGSLGGNYTAGALDSVEPIRAAFDLLTTSDNAAKYEKGIQTIYTMLENQITYTNCAYNYAHKQDNSTTVSSTWSDYPIALDGIYMAEPFLMECANAIDENTLTLTDTSNNTVTSSEIYKTVYDRLVWIYKNLYNSTTELYDHAYNPTTGKTNGVSWSRSIGWYAMALVDIIEMMPDGSDYKSELKDELPQIFDGLLNYQDSTTGLWYNVTAYDSTLTGDHDINGNILETSGSSMFAYAMIKAYQNGYVTDSKYYEAGLKAFNGVVNNKMTGSEGNYSVIDTYKSSGAYSDASWYEYNSYTTNEAKGVGPLIMTAALLQDSTVDDGNAAATTTATTATTETKAATTAAKEDTTKTVSASGYLEETKTDTTEGTYTSKNVSLKKDNTSTYTSGSYYYKEGNSFYKITGITRVSSGNYTVTYDGGTGSASGTNSYTFYTYSGDVTTTKKVAGDPVMFSVTPGTATLNATKGDTTDLTATVSITDKDDTTKSIEVTSSEITWTSSADTIATVDENGKVTAKAKGTATITATLSSVNDTNIVDEDGNDKDITVEITITVTETKTATPKSYYTYDSSLDEAESYPEYPENGAVRINKTATGEDFSTTGVANVELDVAGISVKTGVDVVLVVDVSNSMAWNVDKLTAGKTGTNACPDDGDNSKLDDAMDSATAFTDILLDGNSNNANTDNTVSLVTFGGYDADNWSGTSSYFDSVQTVFSSYTSASDADKIYNSMSLVADSSTGGTGYKMTINGTTGWNYGDTNYDYAFAQTSAAVTALQNAYTTNTGTEYSDSGRETYVVFMTDGAASLYNNTYYRTKNNNYKVYGQSTAYSAAAYTQTNWYTLISENANTYATTLYNLVDGNMSVIGFDLDHGGFGDWTWSASQLTASLEQMVTGQTLNVMAADDSSTLKQYYESLANQIKYAGSNAQVTDTIKSNYTLQMGSTAGTGSVTQGNQPSDITVTAYDLYTKSDATEESLIGTRKGTSSVIETVSFNDDGSEAYSNLIGEGKTNILTTNDDGSVMIEATYFNYTKTAEGVETFVWKIGDITEKEVALSYYVYLKGALEGTAENGTYDTNESAKLDYIDINGDKAEKTFPVPKLSWGAATTSYEYYLVNADGQPVNHAGQVVPFANRIIVSGPTYISLHLNESTTVKASTDIPDGYYLYDSGASYTVTTSSGDNKGSLKINDATTSVQTTIEVSSESKNYTQSLVAFAVRNDLTPSYADFSLNKDQVVIDYGKSIDIDVLKDTTPESGTYENVTYTKKKIVGFADYNEDADLTKIQYNYVETYSSDNDNGSYVITDEGKVRFTPSKMLSSVEKVFCVVEYDSDSDAIYLYEELDIIPATIMYYETNFSSTITKSSDMSQKTDSGSTVTGTISSADGVQNDGTIGQNTYGYDSTYLDDNLLSDGSSYFVDNSAEDSTDTLTVSEFSFTGTGFDLISRTGADQGLIKVSIYSDKNKETSVKTVSVLNKSESDLELYQIPVVSVNNLDYGTYYVTVEVSHSYKNNNYTALSRGGQFYFDAIRVYDPIDVSAGTSATGDAKTAYAAYVADGESANTLTELRAMLLSSEEAANVLSDDDDVAGVLYVDRTQDGVVLEDYTTIGPDNEVYLTGKQAIAFELDMSEGIPSSIDIGAKSADGETAKLHVTVYDADGDDELAGITKEISSSTVEFYDLFDGNSITSKIGDNDSVYVTVDTNDDDGILSLTDLKIAYGDTPSNTLLLATTSLAKKMLSANVSSSEAETEADYDVKSAEFTTAKVVRNKKATMTVVTGADVVSLTVTNSSGKNQTLTTSSTENTDGTKTWTVTFKVTATGTQTYTVTGYGSDGTSSGATATASIKVTLR